ncbi:MAG: sigma-54 dependent transcriptional regulator [Bacteroidales bacterium]|jgi:transcriptional regulator with PAS, ATPase and Fis domain|nr:sigma-54-dependent Fis family transcriptional regulator [Bacteroidales bacterium]MDI9575205.1 sigma-54 dependent transcriptional regulator [Bacteroidota bacterium]MDD2593383.1 sigma-54 dependent transcriptional regulator [Bacteroidales bacterium]HHW60128.1 sigma-54-dependent Fis family transcriptional regulator [Bacteroidales bacterium]HOB77452.1 sigma-54 dependent transcriptional regulator [Bacteroidales bacterium]
MDELYLIKQRFGIIGNSPLLNHAIEVAIQVAPTDLTVLIIGESGTGKEFFPKIIHTYSARKHGPYIAVNCGAIPEGTIDSELFGHEKGSFTGAIDSRKGYFEVANGGTIFLDEVGDLPLSTQVRLLRVLETGEFMRVGSSKVMKTDVRVVAATNANLQEAIAKGKFREDLFYRLSTIPIYIKPLRERKEDIPLLFQKFSTDIAEKYNVPPITLTDDALEMLINYKWPGNVRQLKNVAEQMTIIEKNRKINAETLKKYLPEEKLNLPILLSELSDKDSISERELIYKYLIDMRRDLNEIKKIVFKYLLSNQPIDADTAQKINDMSVSSLPIKIIEQDSYQSINDFRIDEHSINKFKDKTEDAVAYVVEDSVEDSNDDSNENLSLQDNEKELIVRAIKKHNGRRKLAAEELGISERTLYRKIKEYNLEV